MKITTDSIKKIIGKEAISNNDLTLIKRIIETKQNEIDLQLKNEIEIATKKFSEAKAKAEEKVLTKAVQETIKFLNLKIEKFDSNIVDENSKENYHQENNYSGGYQS